jgi:hypothetical protein
MKKSISVNKKSRGRPKKKGGVYPVTAVRLPPETIRGVDEWAHSQDANPGRSEAIRRLVEIGLTVKTSARPASKPGRRLRAQELATKAIEKIIDQDVPPDEQAERRRRLTKGPTEFREDRVDQPKAKK